MLEHTGRGFNTFAIWDEDMTEILEALRFRLFPELKRPKLVRPKNIGEFTAKEWKDMERVGKEMAKRHREKGDRKVGSLKESRRSVR